MGMDDDGSSFWLTLIRCPNRTVHDVGPRLEPASTDFPRPEATATYAAGLGYDILRLHGTTAVGHIDGAEVRGTAYFRRSRSRPSVPWYWGCCTFGWFVPRLVPPHASPTLSRLTIAWKSRDLGHVALSEGVAARRDTRHTERFGASWSGRRTKETSRFHPNVERACLGRPRSVPPWPVRTGPSINPRGRTCEPPYLQRVSLEVRRAPPRRRTRRPDRSGLRGSAETPSTPGVCCTDGVPCWINPQCSILYRGNVHGVLSERRVGVPMTEEATEAPEAPLSHQPRQRSGTNASLRRSSAPSPEKNPPAHAPFLHGFLWIYILAVIMMGVHWLFFNDNLQPLTNDDSSGLTSFLFGLWPTFDLHGRHAVAHVVQRMLNAARPTAG